MDGPRTLMVVHAHPDDEASTTGGILARCAAEGVHTVLVTCTDGRMGDGPDGQKPGEPGHEPDDVAAVRADELAASCLALGIGTVVSLGHHDSGFDEARSPLDARAFSRIDPAPAIATVHQLMLTHRPDVVVTYAENGGSGHPDHVRTHEVTTAAFRRFAAEAEDGRGRPPTLLHIALSRGRLRAIRERVRLELGADAWAPPIEMGIDDDLVTASIDVTDYMPHKRRAISAHASQSDARALAALFQLPGEDTYVEEFVQVLPAVPPGRPATADLFART